MTPSDLTAIRRKLGYNRCAFARALCRDPSTIWRWEKGKKPIPDWLPSRLAILPPCDKPYRVEY